MIKMEKQLLSVIKLSRPLDVNTLLGDAKKARNKLKWKPSIKIETLITEMIDHEYSNLE